VIYYRLITSSLCYAYLYALILILINQPRFARSANHSALIKKIAMSSAAFADQMLSANNVVLVADPTFEVDKIKEQLRT